MTRLEARMLATIKRLQHQQGQMPTRRAIASAMGLAPLGSQQRSILYSLVRKRCVRVAYGQARGIELLT